MTGKTSRRMMPWRAFPLPPVPRCPSGAGIPANTVIPAKAGIQTLAAPRPTRGQGLSILCEIV